MVFCTISKIKKILKIIQILSFQTRSKLENKIEKFFKEISELKNREIVTILRNDFEIVMVYLNTGKIWEAFLKKDDKIYLNTGLDVSIDITDIAEKYYKKF